MKLTILLIFVTCFAFGQKVGQLNDTQTNDTGLVYQSDKQKKDSLTVQANAIQLKRLAKIDSAIQVNQKHFAEILELISGHTISEIEKWKYDKGQFIFYLKPKTKK